MQVLKIALPKGRMQNNLVELLAAAGIKVKTDGRSLRPQCSDVEIEIKLLKPQNIPSLVALGAHDMGFSGYDWIVESGANVSDMLDTGLDPVSIVAAVPQGLDMNALGRKAIVVSEYENIAKRFIKRRGYDCEFVRSFGATEAFPPEDADMIIDNTASGQTLKENGLEVVELLFSSSTRLFASNAALADQWKARKIESIVTLIRSVLAARDKCILEMNCGEEALKTVSAVLPCMRSPTINRLLDGGYAVKSVVQRKDVARIITDLKIAGATDILQYEMSKVVP
jgi:ATP phosphoribosyltransferase